MGGTCPMGRWVDARQRRRHGDVAAWAGAELRRRGYWPRGLVPVMRYMQELDLVVAGCLANGTDKKAATAAAVARMIELRGGDGPRPEPAPMTGSRPWWCVCAWLARCRKPCRRRLLRAKGKGDG